MNAVHHITPLGKFKWLLKREYWENRGGFLWAPVIAGGVSLLLSLMAIVAGLWAASRAAKNGDLHINGVNVNGLDLNLLTSQMTPENMIKWAEGINVTLVLSAGWPFIVLAFVVFFYCLGALYDDRRDRSVLFWKSMPLSDTQTVLSKLASALIVAPVLAVIAGILTMFGFLLMISIVALAHGGSPMTLIWGPANPLTIAAGLVAWIPVYALWALPTAGWLLLCSSWAKSKPFLWAVMLPVFAGVVVSWFGLMKLFDMNANWFWANVVGRLLLGTVPGIEMAYKVNANGEQSLQSALHDVTPASQLTMLAEPQLWIGAAVGVVFIVAAIWLRQRRDEI
jgi:ABC-2 type transport system permease protein